MSLENLILASVFIAVMIISALALQLIFRQREITARLDRTVDSSDDANFHLDPSASDLEDTEENKLIRRYFEVTLKDTNPDSTQNRLIRAGFFGAPAVTIFQILRGVACFALMVGVYLLVMRFAPTAGQTAGIFSGMIAAGVGFIIINIIIDRRGAEKERTYRKLFPDFMDMMIVCLDAGMSLEAAANRVAREFLAKQRDFGLHLSIMMLEVRGGRRLRDALANLAARLRIDEAKSLSVLFRQSEELGTSITTALRIYSSEMREKRQIRAEEKANALPLKMLIPLGAFLFPISLIIVMAPVLIRVLGIVKNLQAPGV